MQKKLLNEVEAKYYSYITGLISTMGNYYNYSLLKSLNGNENLEEFVKIKNENLEKYYYYDLKGNSTYGILVKGKITELLIAEVISFAYRILEEMGIKDLIIKINDKYKNIYKYLDILEVDYEIDNTITDFILENDEEILIKGEINNCNIKFNGNISTLINTLKNIYQNQDVSNKVDVYILAFNSEEKMYGLKILQDIRWSEIKADMDMYGLTLDEQTKKISELKAREIIILKEDELKKGLITIKNTLTNEETKLDETEVLDYLLSNL